MAQFYTVDHSISPTNLTIICLFESYRGPSRRLPLLSMSWIVQAPPSVKPLIEDTATRHLIRAAAVWLDIQVNSHKIRIPIAIPVCAALIFFFSMFGTLGIIGDSNVRCRNISSRADTAGLVGSSCNVGSDCLYGECTSNVCSAPLRQCPSENGKSQRVLYSSSLLFFSSFLYLLHSSIPLY